MKQNKEINIEVEFYPDDGIWFELVDDSVIVKNGSSSNEAGENTGATSDPLSKQIRSDPSTHQ